MIDTVILIALSFMGGCYFTVWYLNWKLTRAGLPKLEDVLEKLED